MDIDAHLSLRSVVKPDLTPLLKFILLALFIHVLFWVNWPIEKNVTVAEIPEWVNIKLIAGFEPTDEKIEKAETKQLKPKTTFKKEKRIVKKRTIKTRWQRFLPTFQSRSALLRSPMYQL